MVHPLTLALLGAALTGAPPFDPLIDAAREPPTGLSMGFGLERLDDTFGFFLEGRSPRFLDDRLVIAVAGGVGWFPEVLVALEEGGQGVDPWKPFAQVRARAELSLRMADTPHRLFVAVGPSVVFAGSDVTRTAAAPGLHSGLGAELFAGDRFRTLPVAVVVEMGAVAHLLSADADGGDGENTASLATGLALSVGLRLYPEPARSTRTGR